MKDKVMCPPPPLTNGVSTSPASSNGDAPPCLGSPADKGAANGFTDDEDPPTLEPSLIPALKKKGPCSISRTSSTSSVELTFQLEMDEEAESAAKKTNDSANVNGTDDLESTYGPKTSEVSTARSNHISVCNDSSEDCLTVHSHEEIDKSIVKTTHCLESKSLDSGGNESKIEGVQSSLLKSIDGSGKGFVDEGLEADKKIKDSSLDVSSKEDEQMLNLKGVDDTSLDRNNEPIGDEGVLTELGSNDSVVPKTTPSSTDEKIECVSMVTSAAEICKDANTLNTDLCTVEQMPRGSEVLKEAADVPASSKNLPVVSKMECVATVASAAQICKDANTLNTEMCTVEQMPRGSEVSKEAADVPDSSKNLPVVSEDCISINSADDCDLASNTEIESDKPSVDISQKCSPKKLQEEPPMCNKNGIDQSNKSTELKVILKSENNGNSRNKDVEPSNPQMRETKESSDAHESNEIGKSSDSGSVKSCLLDKNVHNSVTEIVDENIIVTSQNVGEDGNTCQESTTVSESDKLENLSELKQDCKGSDSQSVPCETAKTQVTKMEVDSSSVDASESSSLVLITNVIKEECVDASDNRSKSPIKLVQNVDMKSEENKCDLIIEVAEPAKTGELGTALPQDDSSALKDSDRMAEKEELAHVPESEGINNKSTNESSSSDKESLHVVNLGTSAKDSAEECKVNVTTALLEDNKDEILESSNESLVETIKIKIDEEDLKVNTVKVEKPVAEALPCTIGDVGLSEVKEKVKQFDNSGAKIETQKEIPDKGDNDETKVSPVITPETFPESESNKCHPNEEKEPIVDVGTENDSKPNLISASTSGDSLPQPLKAVSDLTKDIESHGDIKSDNSDLPPESEINRTPESSCTDIEPLSTKNVEDKMEIDDINAQQSQADGEMSANENGDPTAKQRASNICSDEGNDGILISSDNDDSMGFSGVAQKRTSSHTNQSDTKRAKLMNGHDSDSLTNIDNSVNDVEEVDHDAADEKKATSKRPSESVDSVEAKKVRTSEVSLSTEQVSKILSEEANGRGKSPIMSCLGPKPLSNIDKAIERVAFAGLDKKERMLMPLLRDLKNRNLIAITKDDLDELVSQRLCELLTECGDLFTREKVQKLEQSVEHWKQKAASLQKQITDMTMVFKKLATETKQHPSEMQIPIKITRSVGLQVVMPTWQAVGKTLSPHLKNGLVQSSKRKNGGLITNRNTPHTIQYPTNNSTMTLNRPPLVQKVVTPPTGTPSQIKPAQIISKPQLVSAHSSVVRFRPPSSGVATGTPTSVATVTTTAGGVRTVVQSRPVVKSVMVPRQVEDRVIDLTDEDDKTKRVASNTIVQTMRLTNLNTNTPTASNTIRIVSPQQLTGSQPGVPGVNGQRLTYMLPASAGNTATGRLQLFTQPGGNLVAVSRPNHMPTIMLKNATVMSSAGSVAGNIIRTTGANVVAGQFQQVTPRGRPPTLRMTNGGPPRPIASVVASPLAQHSIRAEHHVVRVGQHPAPLPPPPPEFPSNPSWKKPPPRPDLKISKVDTKDQHGIILSWNMDHGTEHEDIASYQLYAYQENSGPPSTSQWKKVGDVKAMPLPMACTLTQFLEGNKYHFAVRAIDIHSRCGSFSIPGHIILPVRST